jgi:Domain of unknown function (DUF4397)
MQRLLRALCGAALVALTSAVGLPAASAAQEALLRLAHLSPDTPAVDVYVDSVSNPSARFTLPGVSYGAVSPYRSVPPGSYTVAMRAAGASPTTPPVLSTTVQLDAGSARTVAGVGHFSDLGLTVLTDDLTPPPSGQARMRVISAAASAPTVDVSIQGGPEVARGLAFAKTSGYVDVPGRASTLTVTAAGRSPTRIPVDLAAGSVYSVLVLDQKGGGLSVTPVLDAAGSGVMPVGGVETGTGGVAPPAPGLVARVAAIVAALAVTGLALSFHPRMHHPRMHRPRPHGRHGRHGAGS